MDRPFEEMALIAQGFVHEGHTIFQKFTCRGCGARQTMEQPNMFFVTGVCQECDAETDLVRAGCGYSLVVNIAATH